MKNIYGGDPAMLSSAIVAKIDKIKPIDYTKAEEAAELLSAINHPIRKDMLRIIKDSKSISVTDLFVALRMQQAIASRHLGVLKSAGLIVSSKKGKNVFYSVNADRITSINNCLDSLTEGQEHAA